MNPTSNHQSQARHSSWTSFENLMLYSTRVLHSRLAMFGTLFIWAPLVKRHCPIALLTCNRRKMGIRESPAPANTDGANGSIIPRQSSEQTTLDISPARRSTSTPRHQQIVFSQPKLGQTEWIDAMRSGLCRENASRQIQTTISTSTVTVTDS